MLRLFVVFFSLTALALNASAQDNILVNGRILDKSTLEPVPFVHIINKSTGDGVASNVEGSFKVKIAPSDTLIFTAVGYSQYSLVFSKAVPEVNVEIKLDAESMQLKTVNVFAYRDLAALKRAVVNMEIPIEEDKRMKLNLPPVTLEPGNNAGGFSGGITSLINGLGVNKKYNELQKLEEHKIISNRMRLIHDKYNAAVIKKLVDIEEQEIESFMEFCKLSEDFILQASQYNIAVAVNQCFDEYKNLKD